MLRKYFNVKRAVTSALSFILLFQLTNKPVYAWMCTEQNYSTFDICGNLFIPILILVTVLFSLGIILLIVSSYYAFLKKDKVQAKPFLKFGLILLGMAFLLLLLIVPPKNILNIIFVREITS